MSLASITPIIGGAQAAVSSAATIANIIAGLSPSLTGLDACAILAKDIGGFEFDYIGEERVEAGTDITEHYSEDNTFMQDHIAVKPTIITMRGFAAEQSVSRTAILPALSALATALTPVTPYINKYSPGTAAAMVNATSQTETILQALSQIQNLFGSVAKLTGILGRGTPKVQLAYINLDALRTCGFPFAVVTPWATFGDATTNPIPTAGSINSNGIVLPSSANVPAIHGPMMIEHLTMVSPEETRGWADIVVRLKEIRVAPSLSVARMGNTRNNQTPTFNGVSVP